MTTDNSLKQNEDTEITSEVKGECGAQEDADQTHSSHETSSATTNTTENNTTENNTTENNTTTTNTTTTNTTENNTETTASREAGVSPAVEVILASASPRRRELLEREGVVFSVRVSEVDETLEPDLLADPAEAAKKLAERKAGAVVQEILAENFTGMVAVIGADTMVVCDGEIFGKPVSASNAKHMLRRLSGRAHQVMTAVSVWLVAAPEVEQVSLGFRTFCDSATVVFRDITDEEIDNYLRQGESFDKAGAYAVQGKGKDLVAEVQGDLDTVIGLPVKRLLREFPDLV